MIIDNKKTYYYNNRPIKIIQETTEDMYLVCSNLDMVSSELKGENFCGACTLDSKNYEHICDDAEEVIKDVLENLSQEKEVFWVHKKLLKKEYFEQKKNNNLVVNIANLQDKKAILEKNLIKLRNSTQEGYSKYDLIKKQIISAEDLLQKKLREAEKEILEYSSNLEDLKDIKVLSNAGISINISVETYRELLIANSKLNALEAGGIDNWDGEMLFDEVMETDEEGSVDYEKTFDKIIKDQFQEGLETFLEEKRKNKKIK